MFFVIYLCNTAEDASGQRGIWKEHEDLFRTFAIAEPDNMNFATYCRA